MVHSDGFHNLITRRTLITYGLLILFTISFVYVGLGAAKSRSDSLFEFLKDNQVTSGGFQDSNASGTYTLTTFSGFANLYTIDKLGKMEDINDKVQAQNYYKGRFSTAVTEQNVPDIYYSYKCLMFVGGSAETNDTVLAASTIISFRNNVTHGFKTFGDYSESIMITFFAVEYLSESATAFVSAANVTTYVQSCWDATTGAFAGSPGETGNPVDTYYALRILQRLSTMNSLSQAQKDAMGTYLDSFYVDESNFAIHYRGYSYTQDEPYSSLALTFYCVNSLNMIGGPLHSEQTIDWILSRQSPKDFGFQDYTESTETTYSSAILSYYAIDTINTLDSENLAKLLKTDMWMLEINPWYVVAIVAGIIGGIVIICVVIWKLKNRT